MRVESGYSYYNYQPQNIPEYTRFTAPAEMQRTGAFPGQAYILDISPEAWAAYIRSNGTDQARGIGAIEGPQQCETCKNRKYVDQSDDPSVSFQSPAHINPGQAAARVMSHEREHVSNEQEKARRDDRKVISQTVTLTTSICPECGRMYISGGVTRTLTAKNNSGPEESRADPNLQ